MNFKPSHRPRGFALIVTLTLMILLTVLCVGLLTLSTVSLRSASHGDAMQSARANARVALIVAIGDLQKQLGPDTRISATADQIAGGDDGSTSSTPPTQRQWTGAYNSWSAAPPADARPEPEFLQWFVSGPPNSVTSRSFAETSIGTNPTESVEIVSSNSVGPNAYTVRVPLIRQTLANGSESNYAWWVSDLGTKATIAPARDLPTSLADVRADQQVAPSIHLKSASVGAVKPFENLSMLDPGLPNVISWQSGGFLSQSPEGIRGLFHDFTVQNRGLLTNVRAGGFRKDLSMELERPVPPSATTDANVLYRVSRETGINLQELWTYYNMHKQIQRGAGYSFTTGGSMPSRTPHLRVANSPTACAGDNFFFMKQPVIINYQLALSFQTRPEILTNPSRTVQRLRLVADPIITMWNPLDVPVVVPTTAFMSVKYWQIPYDMFIRVNNGPLTRYPFVSSLSGSTLTANQDSNFLSLQIGQSQQVVFKPGEVIKFSQVGNTIVKGTNPVDHRLVARSGFNFGGGVSVPVRDANGRFLDLSLTDTISYEVRPNNLTAGKTSSSGNSLTGGNLHSRHFSVTHHEYYVGADRGGSSESLGIGNMAIDWDFGNRRLKATENRGTSIPGIAGIKPPSGRIVPNAPQYFNIFKTITDGRDLPVSALSAAKQPFMIQSFNAKTENNSDQGTRFLSRFNPKALHVDFYDLSEKERDMLPYEYTVESLGSWKNRNLETSANGNGYYGGGMTATDGTSFLTTHSVPKEPIVSLAAFQHSFANGFEMNKPTWGYATLNAREPMMPQISHAIGNSMASPILPANRVEGTLSGGRSLADHSYLANQALWDDWFLSGITPQTHNTFARVKTQKLVATEFFDSLSPLPVVHYKPRLGNKTAAQLLSKYLPGATPLAVATREIAAFIQVDGMFNVNSTSVEAWKSLLGARNNRPVVVRDASGNESVVSGQADTPIASLLTPQDLIATGGSNVDPQNPSQWVGRRTFTDSEIDQLARAIVKEVRNRGPFLSLADFINRRVGSDEKLARAGAIQSALDSDETKINSAYISAGRAVESATSDRFAFPEAEEGPLSYGSPGVIKQADILTPIAPILSARSDSFLIRAYGEQTDASGKVIARAWCEAVVQRSPEFIDPSDASEKNYSTINTTNQTFGRRFDIVSFRWLNASEA